MFIKRPIRLLFSTENDEGGSGPATEKKPTAEMTPEERIEFEQAAKRSAQDKLKAFGGVTPADVAELQRKLDAAEAEKLTEQQLAVKEAGEQARAEVAAGAALQTVDAVLKVALRGRSADAAALLDLDKAQFVVNGGADVDAITKWVEDHSSTAGERRHVDLGQGPREPMLTTDRATGEAEAQKRFGKK